MKNITNADSNKKFDLQQFIFTKIPLSIFIFFLGPIVWASRHMRKTCIEDGRLTMAGEMLLVGYSFATWQFLILLLFFRYMGS